MTEKETNSGRAERPLPEPFQRPRHTSRVAAVYDLLRLYLGFACYGAGALLVVLVCWLIAVPVRDPARRKHLCQYVVYLALKGWAAVVTRIGIFVFDFPEVERVRALRGTIIAPSHPTLVDALTFLSTVPHVVCLMKKSILQNPFMGSTARLAGYLPNDHGREFIRLGRDALRSGDCLLIFPEGTRTVVSPVNPFKLGFALMAKLADAPVQTVLITVPYRMVGKRWKLWWAPVLPLRIKVRLGEQFRAGPKQSAHDFGAEVEGYFRKRMKDEG